jgi:hypothetical protein
MPGQATLNLGKYKNLKLTAISHHHLFKSEIAKLTIFDSDSELRL